MAADHRVDAVERAGGDDVARAARQQLLRVLEDEAHLAAQLVAQTEQRARDRKQHRGVAVVAAGVHDAFALRRERQAALLLDRERVDVRAQREHRPGAACDEPRQDARRRWPRDLEPAERLERLLDEGAVSCSWNDSSGWRCRCRRHSTASARGSGEVRVDGWRSHG